MGYIKEPIGVTFVVDKKPMTLEVEKTITNFVKESKQKNKELLKKLTWKKSND